MGNGLSGQPAASTSDNTRLPRRGFAAGHRGRGCRLRVKGGGQPSAALTVGSRAVGKRKTLGETETGTTTATRAAILSAQ
jgi:hypothetical protein